MKLYIYIHGFNSSSSSLKAKVLARLIQERHSNIEFWCPDLSHWPEKAVACLLDRISAHPIKDVMLVGSSLGGFYGTYLSHRVGCRSVLINPAITPHTGLLNHVGQQKNLYTGEEYEFTNEHLRQLERLYVKEIKRVEKLFLVHTTGDELLDWKTAARRFDGCRRLIVGGSDHGFTNFEDYADIVLSHLNGEFLP
ncbi:MAG: alpha/beta fold hydrolase [Proteobacteria bacterium]|nr:alpha/beta fold hydrolase [Pseudomonadota bacterium]